MLVSSALLALAIDVQVLATRPDVNWIGLSSPSPDVVWLSGSKATIARSTDGGATWQYSQPTSNDLQFRDIEALDDRHAYALSIGNNGDSRVYYTSNGGRDWQLSYRAGGNQFLNCLASSPKRNEIWVYGDSIDGQWDLVRSPDGRNWLTSRNAIDSPPQGGEGGLAASGGCVRFNNDIWAIATANATTARLLIKRSFGIRFKAIDTPMTAGPNAGIASVWPFSEKHVLMVGGDLNHPERRPRILEYRDDDFTPLAEPPLEGALYSLTVTSSGGLIVSNPDGAAYLPTHESDAWQLISEKNIWNSTCNSQACFLVGKDGYAARFAIPRDVPQE
ncbi:WD40/YVTN/BNR-like repeat-containing protein [Pseudidiomarina aquimaris]|uniref:WD40/YVTN/BNR-like repeat-containing protein n=1 Tax=Pseudidiomarina aquimaris TaxID=641841 RepID=UPI003A9717C7